MVDFQKPSAILTPDTGRGLTMRVNNAAVTVHGDWSYKYILGLIVIKGSGGVTAVANGVSGVMSFTLGKDWEGHPTISSTGCSSQMNPLKITLKTKFKWFYDLFIHKIEPKIRSSIQNAICEMARKIVDDDVGKELRTFPVQHVVENRWVFDYRLIDAPLFAAEYLESFHKGEFFAKNDFRESPYEVSCVCGLKNLIGSLYEE